MKAYLVGFSSLATKDTRWVNTYSSIAKDILKKHEAKVLLIGKPEGIFSKKDWERLTIIEFPSIEKLKSFHEDPEYSKVKELRVKNTFGEMYFLV